jgi:hypothetical protein
MDYLKRKRRTLANYKQILPKVCFESLKKDLWKNWGSPKPPKKYLLKNEKGFFGNFVLLLQIFDFDWNRNI